MWVVGTGPGAFGGAASALLLSHLFSPNRNSFVDCYLQLHLLLPLPILRVLTMS